jgi:hypothetical protein
VAPKVRYGGAAPRAERGGPIESELRRVERQKNNRLSEFRLLQSARNLGVTQSTKQSNIAEYHVPVNADVQDIKVIFVDEVGTDKLSLPLYPTHHPSIPLFESCCVPPKNEKIRFCQKNVFQKNAPVT